MNNGGSDIFEKELYDLTAEQAREVLNAFLQEEKEVFRTLKIEGINLDYSKESVISLFRHAIKEIRASEKPESQYDHAWTLRLAYYFGEALKRNSDKLKWAIGAADFAEENHPVITGFRMRQEAALVVIAKNLIFAVAFHGEEFGRITRAVDAWFEKAEEIKKTH
jgi:hypothetical protein